MRIEKCVDKNIFKRKSKFEQARNTVEILLIF